jgi:hypothetical protein
MTEFAVRRSRFGRKLAIAGAIGKLTTWLCWKFGKAPNRIGHPAGSQ